MLSSGFSSPLKEWEELLTELFWVENKALELTICSYLSACHIRIIASSIFCYTKKYLLSTTSEHLRL